MRVAFGSDWDGNRSRARLARRSTGRLAQWDTSHERSATEVGANSFRAARGLPKYLEILFFRNRGLAGNMAGTRCDEVSR